MIWFRRRPRIRLLALLGFRNEIRFLPDYFTNVAPLVDGVIALDDGSTDGSNEYVSSRPEVLELITNPVVEPHVWDDGLNHRRLVEASWRHDAGWVIGLDADERLEHGFRERAEREIARGLRRGRRALAIHIHELWDDPLYYRADGIWGRKIFARLFEARRDHQFDLGKLHSHWAPLNSRVDGGFPAADLNLYHLRMLHAEDREARRARYEALDPDRQFQKIGYSYLTDTTGIELKRIPRGREYRPLPK